MKNTINSTESGSGKKWPIWPLSITVFLILFVLSLVAFLIFASSQDVGLVARNYYEKELKYQDQIDRRQRANALVVPVKMTYTAANQQYTVEFPDTFVTAGITGELVFYRPNDDKLDSHHNIRPDENNRQFFSTADMTKGLWRVNLTWKANGVEYFNESSFVISR